MTMDPFDQEAAQKRRSRNRTIIIVGGIVVALAALIWWGNRPYQLGLEDRELFVEGYEDGWRESCDYIFRHYPVMYYQSQAYSPASCTGLMPGISPSTLSHENEAGLLSEMEYGDGDAREEGEDQGGNEAIWAFFESVPEVCYGTECFDMLDFQ